MRNCEELKSAAKRLIPGGSMLLSKNPDIYSADYPGYYTSASGCTIKAVDGKKYKDFSFMGIGSCVLGYANKAVNQAVKRAIDSGNMTTMNCPEEIELAELMQDIHGWSGSLRTARTGGEAMAIAVRIARAYTGKSMVMVAGYHGWHDWYLSANIADRNNLDNHLRKNLNIAGVPVELKDSCIPFTVDTFPAVCKKNKKSIAAIILEPARYDLPDIDKLKTIITAAKKADIPVIFDEISSGWRSCLGGLHLKLGIQPDMVVYSKAISNGYPFACVYGIPQVMQAAEKTFISSTYWTEKTGTVAAMATIREMQKKDFTEQIRKSELIRIIWQECAEWYNMPIEVHGDLALSSFSFASDNETRRRHLTSYMLKEGFIFMAAYYASFAHTDRDIYRYREALHRAFADLVLFESSI